MKQEVPDHIFNLEGWKQLSATFTPDWREGVEDILQEEGFGWLGGSLPVTRLTVPESTTSGSICLFEVTVMKRNELRIKPAPEICS